MKKLIILLPLLLTSCFQEEIKPHVISGKTMGTTYSVKYLSNSKKTGLKEKIDKRLVEVNQMMSTYIKDSEISLFNKGSEDKWFSISRDFFGVLNHSLRLAKETNGVYDPTIGPLVNLWGFGPSGKRVVPSKSDLEKSKSYVGYALVETKEEGYQIKKDHPKVYLDLSASAKGFGVDAVALLLEKEGLENFMVEIGGEVKTSGTKNGKFWRIAIETPHPDASDEPYQKVLSISGHAVATSGNYRNFFESKGKRYSHTINFKTGAPVAHTLASVTVVDHGSCMNADALATALMAMGVEKGIKFATDQGIAAYFIYKLDGQDASSFVEKATPVFNQMFK